MGAEQERMALAIAMLKDGMDSALIAKYTGLSIEAVKSMSEETDK